MKKINQFVFGILASVMIISCSSSPGDEVQGKSENGLKFFKSEEGPGHEYFPLVIMREYDNQMTVYSFWKKCGLGEDANVRLYTSINYKPIETNKLFGPEFSSNQCHLEVAFNYKIGHLKVLGRLDADSIDVHMTEVSKDDFIQILTGDDLGFKNYYNNLSSFDQDDYDSACRDAFGDRCGKIMEMSQ